MSVGLTLPFKISSGSVGYFDVTETEIEALKQNLRSLLVTNWGERLMHYDFGCNLREFLFEQAHGEEIKSHIADRIMDQTRKWMPFMKIDQLNIFFEDEDSSIPTNGIGVWITFRIASKPNLTGVLSQIII